MGAQVGGVDGSGSARGYDVGHESFVAGWSSRATTAAWVTSGWAAEDGFDLAEFDAEAADLDLVVGPAEELERARRRVQRARSPVRYIRAPGRAERVGDEPLRGQSGRPR